MEKYKPSYMGQVIPADDPNKMTDFCANKYEAFSKCYDACKEQSENINNVSSVPSEIGSDSFTMKLSTDSDTMEKIKEANSTDGTVNIVGDTITAYK